MIINAVGVRRQRVRIIERHLSTLVTDRQASGLVRGPAQGGSRRRVGTVTSAVTQYTTRLLTPDTWADFAALVEANKLSGVVAGASAFIPRACAKTARRSGAGRGRPPSLTIVTAPSTRCSSIATTGAWAGVSWGPRARCIPSRTGRSMRMGSSSCLTGGLAACLPVPGTAGEAWHGPESKRHWPR